MSSNDKYQPSKHITEDPEDNSPSYPTHPMVSQASSNPSLDVVSALDPPRHMILGSLLTMGQWRGMITQLLLDGHARAEEMLERHYSEQPHRRFRNSVEESSWSLAIEQAFNAV
ncbi:hypothetical protein PQX77_017078 [Marasmius sp. AFHP31]|nr:hypothetical protein PQX77_017078 [Marasmius sp. AFHP31]